VEGGAVAPPFASRSPRAEDKSAMIGETFGRYQIVEALGSGGMGIVYRAHDPTLDRDVALKLLHPETIESAPARERFLREARALSQLNHPHICTVHEIGEVDGRAFIAMEYVKGRSLSSVIPPDGLPIETLIRYGVQIADAIGHAHEHGIVHRDLKSSNVVVTPEGGVKVLDFGIARHEERDEEGALQTKERITQPGVVMGTPGYMAPEVIVGKPADARADIWALGVILHEMTTGALPFAGPTPIEFASAILKEPPAPLPPRVPPMLRGIVQRCLAKEPGQRYHYAGEVRAALEAAASAPLTATVSPQRRVSTRLLGWTIAGAAAAVLVAAVALNTTDWRTNSTETPIRSLAVLPLDNLSGDPEQEYFADGMTDQLTADLSSISTLRVISRTSVMQYKRARKPLPAIAKELNVDAVVEGSVVLVGDEVRITARLVRAATEETLWAQSYERELRDVLALQSEVAKSIANQVDITLTPQEQTRLANARPVDPEVHQLYLLGRFHLNAGTEDGLKKAIQHFESAIAKAPNHAAAYAGVAEAYVLLSSWFMHPHEAMPKARAAAERALQLDESLATGYAVLGHIHLLYDFDAAGAERELRRAMQLNPSDPAARFFFGAYLMTQHRYEEGVTEIRHGADLDPLSVQTYTLGVFLLTIARHYDEAIALANRGLELNPDFALTRALQAAAYLEQGRVKDALANVEQAMRQDRNPTVLGFGAHVHAVAGNKQEAEKLLKEVEEGAKQRYFCPYEIATAYVSMRDFDGAAKWFRKGVEDRADCMAWLGIEPWLEPFRSDPRYPELLRDVGLAPRAATSAK
jgi:eukaryotic-like serine/threonine-protein kinase